MSIGVRRSGAKWSVDLDDLAAASATIPDLERSESLRPILQANAAIYSIPKSIREKVISLHERLGNASTEAMCDALGGESPTWTHTDLTPTQVRRVMKRHRCLICHLAKSGRNLRYRLRPGSAATCRLVSVYPEISSPFRPLPLTDLQCSFYLPT